jgi:uncharacterized heparinase superfamily protein
VTSPGTYLRTLVHLRVPQVALRALVPLRRPRVDVDAAPPPRRAMPGAWVTPAARHASMVGSETWCLLGETRRLDDVGWDDPTMPLLWRYNQHYFDDLNAVDASSRAAWHEALVSRWMNENKPTKGTAWSPYPTSLRLVNWIKWWMSGTTPTDAMIASLATQVRWLRQSLERHVLGNHLFVNAKALWMAGRFFDGDEAASWLQTATAIFERELPEQILHDGGQFERSPMYHALAFEDVLDLVNIDRAFQAPSSTIGRRFLELAPRMHRWLRLMTRPNGTLSRFNDTADGIAPTPSELTRYARDLGLSDDEPLPAGLQPLLPSGYVRGSWDDAVVICDVAPLAPDYLMAHGHADTLAFELYLRGRTVVENGGTSRYGTSPERVAERGTAAHSTVVVSGEDSSEVWSGFRVGRRARIVERHVHPEASVVIGAHDGYRFLPGSPRHRRCWRLLPRGLQIDDELMTTHGDDVGASSLPAVARFHLAPGLSLLGGDARQWQIVADDDGAILASLCVPVGQAAVGRSASSPSFGVVNEAVSVDVTLVAGRSSVTFSW